MLVDGKSVVGRIGQRAHARSRAVDEPEPLEPLEPIAILSADDPEAVQGC